MRKFTKTALSMLLAIVVISSARGTVSAQQSQPQEPEKSVRDSDEAWEFFKTGESHERNNRRRDAVVVYEQAVKIKPDFGYAYYNLGWAYAAVGKFEDALKAHQQALQYAGVKSFKLTLKAAQAHYAIGCDYFNLNRYDEAITSFQRVLESDSGNKETLYEIGRTRIAQGNQDEVMKIAKKLPDYYRDALITELSYANPVNKPETPAAGQKSENEDLPLIPRGIDMPDSPAPTAPSSRPTILYKEKAGYTDAARNKGIQGVIVLSVVFRADGSITNVRVLKGLPYGLSANAILAAYKIRFRPAVKNGTPVSVRGNLEFSFNFY